MNVPPAEPGHRWPYTTAWVLYDLANTVYAATLTFLLMPQFERTFGKVTWFGITNTLSLLLAALLVPYLGALCDRTLRTRRYLTIATLLCIGALATWSQAGSQAAVLLALAVGNVTYNLGLLFYNALLASIAPPERQGRWSGIGTGVGYLGTILVLALLLRGDAADLPRRYLAAAGLFLVFALPCLLLVRDRRRAPPQAPAGALRDSLRALVATLRELPHHRSLMWFLAANFCLVDVLNTAVFYFAGFTSGLFAEQAANGSLAAFGGSLGGGQFLQLAGLGLNGGALVAGLLLGLCTDQRPLQVMRWSAVALLLALVTGVWAGGHSGTWYLLTMVPCGAFGLAGIWTAGRKVVLLLAPPERVGAFFGLYGITTKLSVIGSTTYALLLDGFGSHRPAMLGQSVQLVLGLLLLSLVRLPPHRHAPAQR